MPAKRQPEPNRRPRYACYVRVSVVGGREGDSFISPSVQREQVEAWARLRGVDVVERYEDLDQSGGRLSRPGLDALMQRVRAGELDGVAVARLDRLSRAGVADALGLIEEMAEHGVKLAAVDLGLDPTTTVGEFTLTVLLALARMERRRITEAWDVSNARAIGRGLHFTAQTAFGYLRCAAKPTTKPSEVDVERAAAILRKWGWQGEPVVGQLVPDPVRAPLVREAFERRAHRESWRGIADWLNNVHPRQDGRAWSPRFVATMIQRRTYLGIAHHGKHECADAHPALVTLPEWDAANAVNGGPGPVHEHGSLLAGIIRCAGCRYAMRRTFTTYRDGRRVELYSCGVKHTGGKCPAPANVMAHTVEPAVEEWVTMWEGTAARAEHEDNGHVEEAQREHDHEQARLEAFLADDELRDAVGREAFLAEAERRREAVEEAAEALELARREHAASEHGRVRFLADDYANAAKPERAETLRRVLDSVYVAKGRGDIAPRLYFRWAGEDNHERPQRGTSSYRTMSIPWPDDPVRASVPSWASDDPAQALALADAARWLLSDEKS